MSSNLPLVGAHAVLLGVNAFQQNARSIIFQLNEVNAVTSKLGKDSERHYQAAASAAQRHANVVVASAQRTISSYGAAAKALSKARAEEDIASKQAITAKAAEATAINALTTAQAAATVATNDLAAAQARLNTLQAAGATRRQLGFAQGSITAAQARLNAANTVVQGATAARTGAGVDVNTAEANLKLAETARVSAQAEAALLKQAAAYAVLSAGAAQFNVVLRGLIANFATFISAAQQSAVIVGGIAGVISAVIVGVGIAATKTAATYEDALTRIQAVTEAPRAQMEALDAAIEQIGTTTRVSMSQAAEASEELAKGGLNVAEQLGTNALKAVTNLAQASRGELTPALAATAVAVGLNAFNMTDANKIADALVATVQSSSITFGDLRIAMQQAALTAGNLNYTLPETVAAIGLLGEVGLRGSDAGTSLRTALQHLQKPTEQTRKVMNEFGVSLYDASGRARPLRDVISNLEEAFGKQAIDAGKATEAQRNWALQVIFGTDGARAMLALIDQGVAKFDEFTAAQGRLTAQDLANKYMLPLNAQFDLLGGNVQRVATRIGNSLIPVFGQLISNFTQLLASIPTKTLQLFGLTVSALASDSGFGELNKRITEAFSSEIATRVQQFIGLLRSIADSVRSNIFPALEELATAITKPFNEAGALTNFIGLMKAIGSAVNTATIVVGGLISTAARLISTLRENESAVSAFITMLKGLVAVPIIGLVTIFGGIAIALAKMAAVAFLVGSAIENWDKIKPVVAGIAEAITSNLAKSFVIAAGAAAVFGVAITAAAVAKLVIFVAATIDSIKALANLSKAVLVSAGAALVSAASHARAGAVIAGGYLVAGASAVRNLGLAIMASATWAAQSVRHASIVVVVYATHLPTAIAAGVATMRTALITLTTSFINTAKAASLAAVKIILAWATALGPIIATVSAFITANIVPVLVALAALAAAAVALHRAWETNFLGIQDATKGVLKFVGDLLSQFFQGLKDSPLGEFVTGLIDPFQQFAVGAQSALGLVDTSVAEIEASIKELEAILRGSEVINRPGGQSAILRTSGLPTLPDMSGALPDLDAILSKLEEWTSELERTQQQVEQTIAGTNDFGNAGEEAARKYEQALKSLNELFDDTRRKLANIAEDTAEKIAAAQQKHQDAWVTAHEEATEQIIEVYRNTAQQIEDMWADLDFSRGQRAQKEDLQDQIDNARRARERIRDDADRSEDRRVEGARRARQEQAENAERALQEEIDAADRAASRQVQIEEAAQRRRSQIAQDAMRDRHDAEQRALSDVFDAANRARSAGRDEMRARRQAEQERSRLTSDFARDNARARTEAERQEIAQRFSERLGELNANQQAEAADRAQRRAEELADAAERKRQEEAERALRKRQEAEERNEKEKQDKEDMQRRFNQEDTEFANRKKNDERLRNARKKADETERIEREKEDDAARERRRTLDEEERKTRLLEDQRVRNLEDRLEEESLRRRADNLNKAALERVAAINAELGKKQEAIDKQLKDELTSIERSLADQLRALKDQWTDKIPEILAQGGAAIIPEIERLAGEFISNFNAVDETIRSLIEDIRTAIDLQAELRGDTPSTTPTTPANNNGFGALTGTRPPKFARGGIVPGPFGRPMMVQAHGQEVILGLKASRALMTAENRVASMTQSTYNSPSSVQYNYEYNVDANYSSMQSPASIAMDLRAINAMLR